MSYLSGFAGREWFHRKLPCITKMQDGVSLKTFEPVALVTSNRVPRACLIDLGVGSPNLAPTSSASSRSSLSSMVSEDWE